MNAPRTLWLGSTFLPSRQLANQLLIYVDVTQPALSTAIGRSLHAENSSQTQQSVLGSILLVTTFCPIEYSCVFSSL